MYQQYKDKADFLTIYVREAHPLDEWQMDSNVREDVCYRQPSSLKDRLAIANDFTRRFHYPIPILVDDMADNANRLYAAWPERLYVIEAGGRIIYRGGQGPFDYKPEEVRAILAARFPADATTTPAPAPAPR